MRNNSCSGSEIGALVAGVFVATPGPVFARAELGAGHRNL